MRVYSGLLLGLLVVLLAGVTFSLTSFEGIEHVYFQFKPGSHGSPGRHGRADYLYLLPLEPDRP